MISQIFQLLPDGGYGNSDEEGGNAGGGGPGMMDMDGVAPGGGGGGVTAGCSVADKGGRAKILFQLATSITACDHSADTLEKLLVKY